VRHDMELRRPLYYFTVPGIVMAGARILMGLEFLRIFAHGGDPAVRTGAAYDYVDAGGIVHGIGWDNSPFDLQGTIGGQERACQ